MHTRVWAFDVRGRAAALGKFEDKVNCPEVESDGFCVRGDERAIRYRETSQPGRAKLSGHHHKDRIAFDKGAHTQDIDRSTLTPNRPHGFNSSVSHLEDLLRDVTFAHSRADRVHGGVAIAVNPAKFAGPTGYSL